LCHAPPKALLHAFEDRSLGKIEEAEILTAGTIGEVAARVESVAAEERRPVV
jgi:hypothetical protein